MLVSCTSCSAKFNVPDAKVAGKRARMKCKKCGAPIAIDGTKLKVPDSNDTGAPQPAPKPAADGSKPKRSSSAPKRSVTSSGISTRWRASEPSGKNHEMSLGEIAERYSSGNFEPGTLVCAPGNQDWLPPYDHPEVMDKAAPSGEAPPAREEQPTFSEETVTLGAEESAKLTREAQPSEPDLGKVNTFFGGDDVDDAMDAFDNIMSVAPPQKERAQVQLKNAPADKPAQPPAASSKPSRPPSSKRPAPSSAAPSSSPPPRSSRPAPVSSPPPASTRPSRPAAPKPPSPSQRPSAAPQSNPLAPKSTAPSVPPLPAAPSVPPLFPGSTASAPPAAPASSAPSQPAPSSPAPVSQPPAPGAPSSRPPEAPASASQAPSQPSASMRPSEPTFGNLSQPPKIRKKKSSGLLPIFLVLVLLLGALGGIYVFKPAMFDRGVNRIKGMLGQQTQTAPKAKGPPFDAQAAGAVLGQVAELAGKCKEPGGPTGKGRAEVLFLPAGGATSAAVSKPFHETTVGRCLIDMFKGAQVPAFGGDPVKVSKTFEVQ